MFTHPNPQVRRMHEKSKKESEHKKEPPKMEPPMMEEGEKHVEWHHGPPPDGSMPEATHHTIHHPEGTMHGHNSAQEAHQAMDEHMGEASPEMESPDEMSSDSEY